jgi:Na+/melibiose symporter-like transporter
MLEIIVFILLFYAVGSWLMGKLAKRPDGGCRGITMGCGLFLAVFMTVMFIQVVSDPTDEFMAALVIVPWIVLGIMLIVKAVKER